jgi:hypothetical protein
MPRREGPDMRKSVAVLACVCACLLGSQGSAAVKYKRFPRCPEGLVSAKTCECHIGTTGRYHFCHTGHYCHFDGTCHE